MTERHTNEQERAEFEDGTWYWVEKEGWHDDPPEIAPAMYRANSMAWYSYRFGGVPTRELKILEPCLMQAARRAQVVSDVTPEMVDAALEAYMPFGDMALAIASALAAAPQPPEARCTCPSGDGSLRWPCQAHPPEAAPVASSAA